MKRILILLFAGILLTGLSASAQKVGHIDLDSLIRSMPQMDSVKKVSQEYAKVLDGQYQSLVTEFNTKYQDYTAKEATWTDSFKAMKKKELENLQQSIQEFQQTAQQDMQTKNDALLAPLEKKARKAIDDVAKEGKYSMVLDSSAGGILYSLPGDDLMVAVKAKLKIK
jgi:outer membrane protein